MLSGSRSNIAVKMFGPDLGELRRLTAAIKGVVQNVEGAVDVTDEQQNDIPFLTMRFKRDALARHGLSIRQVAETVETAFSGMAVIYLMAFPYLIVAVAFYFLFRYYRKSGSK